MATRPTRSQARQFAQLIEEHEPVVKRAFMASVADLQANVDWRSLLLALERGDIYGAITALNISTEAWAEYSAAVTGAYTAETPALIVSENAQARSRGANLGAVPAAPEPASSTSNVISL